MTSIWGRVTSILMTPATKVFVDTAAWADLVLGDAEIHAAMEDYYKQLLANRRQLVTSNYILTEVVALLTSPGRVPRPRVIDYVNRLKGMKQLSIVHIDSTLDAEAWALLERRPDKEWSLVDASSFIIMTRERITDVFTTNRHFEQA